MRKQILLIAISIIGINLSAQDVSELDNLKEEYKGINVIYLKDIDRFTVNIKGEDIIIKHETYERKFYLTNKAQSYSEDYITSSPFKKIDKIEFYTESKVNGKYKKIKSKDIDENKVIDNDIFDHDIKTYTFVYPELREDAISNLRVSYYTNEPHLFPGIIFQNFSPIIDKELIVDVDENVNMAFAKFNFDSLSVDTSIEKKKHRIIYTFSAKNVKRLKDENDLPPILFVVPHIIPYIKSYKTKTKTVNILRNSTDLFDWYHSLLQKDTCNNSQELIEKAEDLTKKCKSEEEKVKTIFNWVQKNINYIAIEIGLGRFIPQCAEEVFKNKYGDCKGMANIMHKMLEAVNINSYLTVVGTTDRPYKYSNLPTPNVDNHMILTYVDKNKKYHYLDATSKYGLYEFPSAFIQGKEVMIDMDGKQEIKTVPVVPCDENQQIDTTKLVINDNVLSGRSSVTLTGFLYEKLRRNTANIYDQKKLSKYLNNYFDRGNNKFIITKTEQEVFEEQGAINFKYDFTIGDYITRSNDQIFLNMNIYKAMLDDKIEKDRQYPMFFSFCKSYKYYLDIKIPENYVVDHTPENVNFENKFYKIDIKYSNKDSKHLIYELYAHYNTLQLYKKDFKQFNDFNNFVHKNFRDVVILKKQE